MSQSSTLVNIKLSLYFVNTYIDRLMLNYLFCSAIIDCLVTPLQEKIEDWKKAVINLDKEHAKGKLKLRWLLQFVRRLVLTVQVWKPVELTEVVLCTSTSKVPPYFFQDVELSSIEALTP